MSAKVLIIDDEDLFREDLAELFAGQGYECRTAADGNHGVAVAEEFGPDVVLCDVVMPGRSGIEVLEEIVRVCPESCVIMLTAYGTLETAVEAFREGASDYILKPFVLEDVLQKIVRYLQHRALLVEVRRLRRELSYQIGPIPLMGESELMRQVFAWIEKVSQTDSTVLLTGESGTGKELVARAIHEASTLREGPFVAVNCAALSPSLLENELFGHVKGAFTGADRDRPGLFEAAAGGTLFLDEISEMPLDLQAKLLRAIEQKEVVRVGSTRPICVKVRIIASSNRDLKRQVQGGKFRADLFFRIYVVEIHLPPLRERRKDIPLLVEHFIKKYNERLKKNFLGVDNEVMRILLAYPWPGNVRELENVIERAMILATGDFLGVGDLPPDITGSVQFPDLSDNLREAVKAYEREHIRQVLLSAGGNREEAARRLGVNPSTLYRKMAELSIQDT